MDAQRKCVAQGADLVGINYEAENVFITKLGAKYAPGKKRLWIGLHRDCNNEFSTWTEGLPVRYFARTVYGVCMRVCVYVCMYVYVYTYI